MWTYQEFSLLQVQCGREHIVLFDLVQLVVTQQLVLQVLWFDVDCFRHLGFHVQSFAGSVHICHDPVTMFQFGHNTGSGDKDFLVPLGEDIQLQNEVDLVVWYVIFASVVDQKILIKEHKHTLVIMNYWIFYWRD